MCVRNGEFRCAESTRIRYLSRAARGNAIQIPLKNLNGDAHPCGMLRLLRAGHMHDKEDDE